MMSRGKHSIFWPQVAGKKLQEASVLTALTALRALEVVWMDEPNRSELCPECEGPMQEDWEDGSGCPECNPDYYDYHPEEAFQNFCDEYHGDPY